MYCNNTVHHHQHQKHLVRCMVFTMHTSSRIEQPCGEHQSLTTASRLLAQSLTTLRPVALILAVRWSTATLEGAQTRTWHYNSRRQDGIVTCIRSDGQAHYQIAALPVWHYNSRRQDGIVTCIRSDGQTHYQIAALPVQHFFLLLFFSSVYLSLSHESLPSPRHREGMVQKRKGEIIWTNQN